MLVDLLRRQNAQLRQLLVQASLCDRRLYCGAIYAGPPSSADCFLIWPRVDRAEILPQFCSSKIENFQLFRVLS